MNQLRNWTPAENEFFAENELIEVLPLFKGDEFKFVSGTFGPFRANIPILVPLWLAVYLKQRNKCDIQVPNWLDVEFLQKVTTEEKSSSDFS